MESSDKSKADAGDDQEAPEREEAESETVGKKETKPKLFSSGWAVVGTVLVGAVIYPFLRPGYRPGMLPLVIGGVISGLVGGQIARWKHNRASTKGEHEHNGKG